MAIAKKEMQSELKQFIEDFAEAINRMYFHIGESGLVGHSDFKPEGTPLWATVNRMYEYGVAGIPQEGSDLGEGLMLDPFFVDVEMFLRGLDSLATYLEEVGCSIPRTSIRVVRTAIARHVLEGGDRFTAFEDGGDANLLSFEEMALLANMDERSVRNAANPKVADPLMTVTSGKRTFIEPGEAKRWLANRKGFVPTQTVTTAPNDEAAELKVKVEIEQTTLDKLQSMAKTQGITVDRLLAQLAQ